MVRSIVNMLTNARVGCWREAVGWGESLMLGASSIGPETSVTRKARASNLSSSEREERVKAVFGKSHDRAALRSWHQKCVSAKVYFGWAPAVSPLPGALPIQCAVFGLDVKKWQDMYADKIRRKVAVGTPPSPSESFCRPLQAQTGNFFFLRTSESALQSGQLHHLEFESVTTYIFCVSSPWYFPAFDGFLYISPPFHYSFLSISPPKPLPASHNGSR